MPVKIRGYIYEDVATGDQVCILNARLTHEANQQTYNHECHHITCGDLDREDDIDTMEARAHRN